jgi:hypothetical protein
MAMLLPMRSIGRNYFHALWRDIHHTLRKCSVSTVSVTGAEARARKVRRQIRSQASRLLIYFRLDRPTALQ